jgi:signal recognition particle receptor subunit alpha
MATMHHETLPTLVHPTPQLTTLVLPQAVYRSLLHLSWVDKLVDNIKTIFVSLYGEQLKKPHTTLVECLKFDEYFDQQLQELDQTSASGALNVPQVELPSGDGIASGGAEPPTAPGLTYRGRAIQNGSGQEATTSADSTPIQTPNASRPSTPGNNSHLLVAKAGPIAKMSRRARKKNNAASNSAPASSGDEGPASRDAKRNIAKSAKKGRKWDDDGYAVEDDGVQLDYSANPVSDSDAEPVARSTAVDSVDASTWGSTTKGKFVLRDLGDEVHDILASAEAKKVEAEKKDSTGILGSGLNAVSGLFRNVVGGKTLTKEDLDKAMKGMEDHLLRKNVAREAAVRLCEGVEKELVGVKTGNFESMLGLLAIY